MSKTEAKQSQLRQAIQNALLQSYGLSFPQLVRTTCISGYDLLLLIHALHELVEAGHVLEVGDRYKRTTLRKRENNNER